MCGDPNYPNITLPTLRVHAEHIYKPINESTGRILISCLLLKIYFLWICGRASQLSTVMFSTATISLFAKRYLREFFELQIIVSSADWFNSLDVEFWKDVLHAAQENPYYTLGFQLPAEKARHFYEFTMQHNLPVSLILGENELSAGTFMRSFSNGSGGDDSEFGVKSSIGSRMGIVGTGLNLPER